MADRTPKGLKTRNFLRVVEHIGSQEFVRKWGLMVTTLSLFISMLSILTVALLLPLKEPKPYFLTQTSDGNIVLSKQVATQFQVTDANIKFFAGKMLRNLLTIDEQLVSRLNELRETMLRGAAVAQFRDFVFVKDRPIARFKENPGLRRDVQFDSDMTILKSNRRRGQVVAFLSTRTIGKNGEKVEPLVATIDYALVDPKTYKDVMRNPVGFFVTGFKIEPR